MKISFYAALAFVAGLVAPCEVRAGIVVRVAPDASLQQQLAAKEVNRYLYLRTGALPANIAQNGTVVVTTNDNALLTDATVLNASAGLQPQQYVIQTTVTNGSTTWWIVGGDDQGALYGAYRFAELLGVRFYLHGDVVPDAQLTAIPSMNETGKPLFQLRGLNPWGSHPFGIDAWGTDDYKAAITQLAKMRMNFIGLHCYPEGYPYAEPTVWHGLASDFDPTTGNVSQSYVSRYYNTFLIPAWGNYEAKSTSAYTFGGAQLFDDPAWAPDVFSGHTPLPVSAADCNDVFNRMGAQFGDAFSLARELGVKTCVGTETPLVIPQALATQTTNKEAVYEGTFKRIMATHPLDYYWIWTPEVWSDPTEYSDSVTDFNLAIQALKNVNAPFQLALCGWGMTTSEGNGNSAGYDSALPKNIPISSLNHALGTSPVDPAFGLISGRDKWAMPWIEGDSNQGLAGLQLWAGRMRRDALDAYTYGCNGLLGLQWRTDIVAPNVSALAQAAWDQSWAAGGTVLLPGSSYAVSNPISGTTDGTLYQTCRYNLGAIRFRVPPGTYNVTLKFCEPFFNSAGQRVFDVDIQGNTVISGLDIFKQVGEFAALDYVFNNIAVGSDGVMAIDLVNKISLPCISAIEVQNASYTLKVNCGGPAYQDWQAGGDLPRALPVNDFYSDWAQANFGLASAGSIFAALDENSPLVTPAGFPVGPMSVNTAPWSSVAPTYAFVDQFQALASSITGAGNLARFNYWLNTFKYLRALAETRCAMGAGQTANVFSDWSQAYTCLLQSVNSTGAMGTVATMENDKDWGDAVGVYAGQPWPTTYQGTPRLIVPTVRSVIDKGESLAVKVIALSATSVGSVTFNVRPLGSGAWQAIPAQPLTSSVYKVQLPAATADYEYYITSGTNLIWPATAPTMNQTVVVMDAPSSTYATWAGPAGFNLTGGPGGDDDNDGISNLLEYVLGGNPLEHTSSAILPVATMSSGNFVFTFHRGNSTTADTTQIFQYSTDLSNWTDVPLVQGGMVSIVSDTPQAGTDQITVTVPTNSSPRMFGRLKVTMP